MKFSEFNFDGKILGSLQRAGYENAMEVQTRTLKHTLEGKDVLVQSQTGTGKTAAFLISIFAMLRSDEFNKKKALIIAPTRELAVQIEKEAKLLGQGLGHSICSFYGGTGYRHQEKCLASGVEIMIGTPGRVLDFKQSGRIDFSQIDMFVLDEADRLFDMGFLPDITEMLRSLPPCSERKTMLFSATLSREVRMIARSYMDNPVEIEVEPEQVTVDAIEQQLFHVSNSEKMNLLLGILKRESPKNALIFTNMKGRARTIAQRLRHNGYTCEFLSGDLPQSKRSRVVEAVKKGRVSYLVATDVAARGIHINDLELVINYDIPEHSENYVHRIGRTARAGKSGKAISLVCEDYVHGLRPIEKYTKTKIPVGVVDSELFVDDTSEGIDFNKPSGNGGYQRNGNRRSGSASSTTGRYNRSGGKPGNRSAGKGNFPQRKKYNGSASSPSTGHSSNGNRKRRYNGEGVNRANQNHSFKTTRNNTNSAQAAPAPIRPDREPVEQKKQGRKKKGNWLKKVSSKILGK
ncbi:DEAD/DEAH box helicase [Chitinispirillales bacterium ANBcel5]|uniref:DEAD/DEAH box helicase n=1 Tax=Cellulosispirillum alkaliphilum TaxID=3039283 RepID=UPI002A57D22E|nr:DEAD/DEAH box helicase [Chitinispirillales bacterium ANBcel5]